MLVILSLFGLFLLSFCFSPPTILQPFSFHFPQRISLPPIPPTRSPKVKLLNNQYSCFLAVIAITLTALTLGEDRDKTSVVDGSVYPDQPNLL